MLLQAQIITTLIVFVGMNLAAAIKEKRDSMITTLYAYGGDIAGAPVFFVDGFAYVGNEQPDFGTVVTNITLSTDTTNSTAPWIIASNNSTSNSTRVNGASLYIIPTTGSTAQVGFVPADTAAPVGGVTEGFTWFGTQVAYIADDSSLEMQFWAMATNNSGVWSLVWNADGGLIEDAAPVNLKMTAPTIIDVV